VLKAAATRWRNTLGLPGHGCPPGAVARLARRLRACVGHCCRGGSQGMPRHESASHGVTTVFAALQASRGPLAEAIGSPGGLDEKADLVVTSTDGRAAAVAAGSMSGCLRPRRNRHPAPPMTARPFFRGCCGSAPLDATDASSGFNETAMGVASDVGLGAAGLGPESRRVEGGSVIEAASGSFGPASEIAVARSRDGRRLC